MAEAVDLPGVATARVPTPAGLVPHARPYAKKVHAIVLDHPNWTLAAVSVLVVLPRPALWWAVVFLEIGLAAIRIALSYRRFDCDRRAEIARVLDGVPRFAASPRVLSCRELVARIHSANRQVARGNFANEVVWRGFIAGSVAGVGLAWPLLLAQRSTQMPPLVASWVDALLPWRFPDLPFGIAWIGLRLAYLGLVAVFFGIPFLILDVVAPQLGYRRALLHFGPILVAGYMTGIYVIGLQQTAYDEPSTFLRLVALGMLSASLLGLGLALTYVTSNLVRQLRDDLAPDAVVVSCLWCALRDLQRNRPPWPSLDLRKRLLNRLEVAALCLERSLCRQLAPGDPETDRWLRRELAARAAGIRALKTWVLTPGWSTRQDLADHLTHQLILFVEGRWDALNRGAVPPDDPTRRGFLAARFGLVVGVLWALAPWVVLYLVQSPLADPVKRLAPAINWGAIDWGSYFIPAVIWTATNAMAVLDPYFSTAAPAYKELLSAATASTSTRSH